jgi:hypothetical protein
VGEIFAMEEYEKGLECFSRLKGRAILIPGEQ